PRQPAHAGRREHQVDGRRGTGEEAVRTHDDLALAPHHRSAVTVDADVGRHGAGEARGVERGEVAEESGTEAGPVAHHRGRSPAGPQDDRTGPAWLHDDRAGPACPHRSASALTHRTYPVPCPAPTPTACSTPH